MRADIFDVESLAVRLKPEFFVKPLRAQPGVAPDDMRLGKVQRQWRQCALEKAGAQALMLHGGVDAHPAKLHRGELRKAGLAAQNQGHRRDAARVIFGLEESKM